MNIFDKIIYYFYAPNGRFEPCGMFTAGHYTAGAICLCMAVICIVILNKMSSENLFKLTRFFAYFLTALELIKISHSFIHGELHLDAWFPLSYCGLFIFALWMIAYGKSRIKSAGKSFVAYGCPFAGVAFIIFPTTSLMNFPIYHFLSLYSMLFHTVMIIIGVVYLKKDDGLDLKKFKAYWAFVLPFAAISITMNELFGCNLMILREPYNIPIRFIQTIYNLEAFLYTLIVLIIYALIPCIVSFFRQKT